MHLKKPRKNKPINNSKYQMDKLLNIFLICNKELIPKIIKQVILEQLQSRKNNSIGPKSLFRIGWKPSNNKEDFNNKKINKNNCKGQVKLEISHYLHLFNLSLNNQSNNLNQYRLLYQTPKVSNFSRRRHRQNKHKNQYKSYQVRSQKKN